MKLKFFLVLLFCTITFAQQVHSQQIFQLTSTSGTENKICDLKHSANGGIIILEESFTNATHYIGIRKLLIDFSLVWSNSFFTTDSTISPITISETADRSFLIASEFHQGGGSSASTDILLTKTDDQGQSLWSKRIDHFYSDQPKSIVPVSDGTIFICSDGTGPGLPNAHKISLIRSDSTGNVQWSEFIGGSGDDIPCHMILTSDDQLAIAGTSSSFSGGTGFFLAKLDTSGNYLWFTSYFSGFEDTCYDMIQTNDGGYLMLGSGGSGGEEILLIKTDPNGILQFAHSYSLGFGTNNNTDKGIRILNTADGAYAFTGTSTQSGSSLPFIFMIKISQNFAIDWHNSYGYLLNNNLSAFIQMPDDGYAMAGSRIPSSSTNRKNLVIKSDSLGNTGCLQTMTDLSEFSIAPLVTSVNPSVVNTVVTESPYNLSSSVPSYTTDTACYVITVIPDQSPGYTFWTAGPNPFHNRITLTSEKAQSHKKVQIIIRDQLGRRCFDEVKALNGEKSISLDLSFLEQGLYFLSIHSEDTSIQTIQLICTNRRN